MKRRDLAGLAAAGLIAPAARAQGGPVEGKQYKRLPQALPDTPGKIEVIEFFYYHCPFCNAFDPLLEAWVHQLPADVSFRRVHVGAQAMIRLHQRMFYALEAMGALTPAVHTGLFSAFHRQGIEANDEAAVVALVGRLGVDTEKFKAAFNSFGVQTKLLQATRLVEQCGIDGVPALVVAGRWRVTAGGQEALQVADFLIQRARNKA